MAMPRSLAYMAALLWTVVVSAYRPLLTSQPRCRLASAAVRRLSSDPRCFADQKPSVPRRVPRTTMAEVQELLRPPSTAPQTINGNNGYNVDVPLSQESDGVGSDVGALHSVSSSSSSSSDSSSNSESAARKHTEESKRKISAANKGRTPWNAGKKHSEETRRKIAEGTRRAIERKAAEAKAARERLRLEDPEAYQSLLAKEEAEKEAAEQARIEGRAEQRRRAKRAAQKRREEAAKFRAAEKGESGRNGAQPIKGRVNFKLSAESRAKISESLRKRWQDPEYRAKRTTNITRSEKTRAQISRTMKLKWQNETYRERMVAKNGTHTAERRAKIAAAIKKKWQDPEYRMRATLGIRRAHENETWRRGGVSPEARKKISEAMKKRWSQPEFRRDQVEAIRKNRAERQSATASQQRPVPWQTQSKTERTSPESASGVARDGSPTSATSKAAAGLDAEKDDELDAELDDEEEAPEDVSEMVQQESKPTEEEEEVVVMAWGDTIIDFGE